jgi:hypothetical protein
VTQLSLFPTHKKPNGYQGTRPIFPGLVGTPVSVLLGSAIIAAAILLSTLITAVGTRFIGVESSLEDNVWLIDRLTGSVYRCKAPERSRAICDAETATGSIGERPKPSTP